MSNSFFVPNCQISMLNIVIRSIGITKYDYLCSPLSGDATDRHRLSHYLSIQKDYVFY